MSQWIGFTNQKLYQCRLLLAQRDKTEDASLARAAEEGAIHLLNDAWLSYLQELGDMVAFRQPVNSLTELMAQCRMTTGEMRELTQLADNSYSWLAQFLLAVPALNRPDAVRPSAPADGGLIAVSMDTGPDTQVDDWYRELQGLIDRQRENRQET